MMSPPPVFAIVLTWNSGDDALECLRTLAASDYPALSVIVVDNASTDDTPARIASAFPESSAPPQGVTVLRNSHNLGFAEGNNVGLRLALERGAHYLLLLNPDAFVSPSAISTLVERAEQNPHAGLLCPALVSAAAPTFQYLGGTIDWTRGEAYENLMPSTSPDVLETDYAPGCAVLARASVVRQIGMLDPTYFAYYEDVDWSVRCRRAGHAVLAVPGASVRHKGTRDQSLDKSPVAAYLARRNQALFITRFVPRAHLLRVLTNYVSMCHHEAEMYLARGAPKQALAVADGVWSGLMRRYGPPAPGAPSFWRHFFFHPPALVRRAPGLIAALRRRMPIRTGLRRIAARVPRL